jgi:hypothetical protein
VILAPCDLLRTNPEVSQPPPWLPQRYQQIRQALRALPPLPAAAVALEQHL